ncbi:MAG: sialate O-acetylesterase [Phycisphaeraceae bacterium]
MQATSLSAFCLCLSLLTITFTAPTQAASTTQADDEPKIAQVYILSGQSNMFGSGQAKELDPAWQKPIDGAMIFNAKNAKKKTTDTFGILEAGTTGRFGPEIGFAHYLRNNQPGRPNIYLIKFALGGQPLDAGWGAAKANGGGWAGPEPGPNRKTFYPGTSPDDPNIGLHYKRLHDYIAKAIKQLKADGYTPQIQGILWMQGEADAKHEVSAGRYDKTLALLKQRLEDDFASGKNVPFVFGQVLPHEPALERFTSRKLIRQRMAEADWRSGNDRAIDNVWMVSTDGMDLMKDTVHYSTKGLLSLGQAFGLETLKAHRKAEEENKE